MRLLRFTDLKDRRICNNRVTLSRWMALPIERDPFPRPIHVGANSVAWLEDEVFAWLERRRAAHIERIT